MTLLRPRRENEIPKFKKKSFSEFAEIFIQLQNFTWRFQATLTGAGGTVAERANARVAAPVVRDVSS